MIHIALYFPGMSRADGERLESVAYILVIDIYRSIRLVGNNGDIVVLLSSRRCSNYRDILQHHLINAVVTQLFWKRIFKGSIVRVFDIYEGGCFC